MTDSHTEDRGCYCLAGLECILNLFRALPLGSCLSSESRSPRDGSPLAIKRRGSRKRLGSLNSSFDYGRDDQLHRIPGRLFVSGSCEIACLFTQQGRKGTNQDAMIFWENFCLRKDTIFCGVFDGHGPYGHFVARKVRDGLPLKLNAHWESAVRTNNAVKVANLDSTDSLFSEEAPFLPVDEEGRVSIDDEETGQQSKDLDALKESFLKAYKAMDRELRIHANIDCFCSGTTAVTLVKKGQDLVIGNVGDSRAVLATRDDKNSLTAVQLTVDLKPNLPEEAERIRKCRGRVFALPDEPEVARVWLPNNDSPGLAMARAFGDFCLKDFGLISVPEVSCRRITDRDEFVVLATDGIWDVLSNQEVVGIVDSCPTRKIAARTLVESAVKAWRSKYPTSKVDDCAVVCLFLDSNESATCIDNCEPTVAKDEDDASGHTVSNCSGKAKASTDEVSERDHDIECSDYEQMNDGFEQWSALEGVARVNTLMDLPIFTPGKENGEGNGNAAAERKG